MFLFLYSYSTSSRVYFFYKQEQSYNSFSLQWFMFDVLGMFLFSFNGMVNVMLEPLHHKFTINEGEGKCAITVFLYPKLKN